MVMPPEKLMRRNISAAANPAAPPPRMTTVDGASVACGLGDGAGSFLPVTKILPSRWATDQQETGLSAGARKGSPDRRLKRAWCQGQHTVSPDSIPSARGPL